MMNILDATIQNCIHLGNNMTLLNKNESRSDKAVNHWTLMICSKVTKFTKAY
jgi:hypothetical protein